MIGILGYKLLRTLFPEPDKAKAAVTLLSLAVGAPVLLIYARAFLRMLL